MKHGNWSGNEKVLGPMHWKSWRWPENLGGLGYSKMRARKIRGGVQSRVIYGIRARGR